MSPANPAGFVDKAVGVCLSVLVAAVAVFFAVQLIEAVWPVLVAIAVSAAVVSVVVVLVRRRSQGW